MQLYHEGAWQFRLPFVPELLFDRSFIGAPPVSMKGALNEFHEDVPRELTIAEIEEILDKVAAAAVRS